MSASEMTPLASSPAEKPLYFVPRNRTFVEDDDDSSKTLPAPPPESASNKAAPKGYQAIGKDAPTAEVRRMRAALPRKVTARSIRNLCLDVYSTCVITSAYYFAELKWMNRSNEW